MKVYLIGTGCGPGTCTTEALEVIRQADCLIGAVRLTDAVKDCLKAGAKIYTEIFSEKILNDLLEVKAENEAALAAVVFSGDSGFYSGAAGLSLKLKAAGIDFRILPGISSVQLLSAALCTPWQNWRLVSGHGRTVDVISEIMHGQDTFFLTDSTLTPGRICAGLSAAGLGELKVSVGENLGSSEERVSCGTAEELAAKEFSTLSVVLVEKASVEQFTSGILDRDMIRGKVPMTKQEVRAAIVNHLQPGEKDVVWDVGAGTGSVSIALACAAKYGRTWAVEQKEEAVELIRTNRAKLHVWNLEVVMGKAPDALKELPAPDTVFIGGSSGNLKTITDVILEKNPKAKICVSAVLVETLAEAVRVFAEYGISCQVTQIAVTESTPLAGKHMMKSQNAIWLVTRETDEEKAGETV